jgi:RNA polymerase sigma-70 factor (ECF subfamily)
MDAVPEFACQFAPLAAQSDDEERARPTKRAWLPRAEPAMQREATQHREAVAQWVDRHSSLVYRVAFAVVRNAADAEDVVQETFLQLLRGSPGLLLAGVIADERGYLARIAWRLAVRRAKRQPADDASEVILLREPAIGRSPEEAAADGELERWLHRQIDALPQRLSRPLTLAALGELTSPQIATVLEIPEGTVRRRIHEARQRLKTLLEEQSRIQQRSGGTR